MRDRARERENGEKPNEWNKRENEECEMREVVVIKCCLSWLLKRSYSSISTLALNQTARHFSFTCAWYAVFFVCAILGAIKSFARLIFMPKPLSTTRETNRKKNWPCTKEWISKQRDMDSGREQKQTREKNTVEANIFPTSNKKSLRRIANGDFQIHRRKKQFGLVRCVLFRAIHFTCLLQYGSYATFLMLFDSLRSAFMYEVCIYIYVVWPKLSTFFFIFHLFRFGHWNDVFCPFGLKTSKHQ